MLVDDFLRVFAPMSMCLSSEVGLVDAYILAKFALQLCDLCFKRCGSCMKVFFLDATSNNDMQ